MKKNENSPNAKTNKITHAGSFNLEIQNLKEIIEIAKQITSGLDVKFILKNAVLSLFSKFSPGCIGFYLPKDIDDYTPLSYIFKDNASLNNIPEFDSLLPLFQFFEKQEFNQILFDPFCKIFKDKIILKELIRYSPEFIIPIRSYKGPLGIYFQGKKQNGEAYSTEDIQYSINILNFASIALENANLYREATVDRMTKLYTHHQFEKRLDEEIKKSQRYHTTFSLIMFDIDHFKDFNDRYGHLQGDIIIKEISRILTGSLRSIDFPARYGGEEFVVILPEIRLNSALIVAERLRQLVEQYSFPGDGGPYNAQISLGVIEMDPEQVKYNEEIMEAVDTALYHSKEGGRNRISIGHYKKTPEIYIPQ